MQLKNLSLQPVYRSWGKPNAGLQVHKNEGAAWKSWNTDAKRWQTCNHLRPWSHVECCTTLCVVLPLTGELLDVHKLGIEIENSCGTGTGSCFESLWLTRSACREQSLELLCYFGRSVSSTCPGGSESWIENLFHSKPLQRNPPRLQQIYLT